MAGVRLASQGVENQDVELPEQREALGRDVIHVRKVRGGAEAVAGDGVAAMGDGDSLEGCPKEIDGCAGCVREAM